jgi:outer membrane protein OmpA-like peptidoglycan-associated protein
VLKITHINNISSKEFYMEISKNLSLAAIALLLLLPSCGKKEKKAEEKKVALANQKEIPVLKEEVEEFVDDDNIQEFAFVEDEKNNKDQQNETKPLAMADEEDTFSDDVSWEEEAPKEEELSTQETKNAYSFKTVYFDLNKNNIRKDQKEVVSTDIQSAKQAISEGKKVVIGGHCCQLGSPSYNLSLSERRANTLKKEMVRKGIPSENIKAIGYGQEMPVVCSDTSNKKALIKELAPNRRAEIAIN